MLPLEEETAEIYGLVRSLDPMGLIDQYRSLTAVNQYRLLYALIARYVPPGSTVLDWGCGRGHFSFYLLRHGYRVTAFSLEPEPEIFGSLSPEERSRLTFVRESDPGALPFPANAFDAVFSIGVLEHVKETGGSEVSSLQELRRVLSPAGHLLVYHFPNRLSYIEALSRLIYGRRYAHIPESVKFHKHLYSAPDIRALTEASGFSVVACRRYGLLPRNVFNRFPASLRASHSLASAVNLADLLLERLLAPFTQNFYFIGRRTGALPRMQRTRCACR
ncbi:MAG TPA: class I SAM-dependent methyltransferase [Thermoanaerobaculia bacterium]|nr:class I SAM-dependent methyltransferase [Thermoanaerobaculia bacterium]